ncbi:MAG: Asr1405/Asl0597 family protein [Cyanobacteria bacterium P01_H01_bin.21]
MVEIDCCERWEAFFRLKELGIACDCKSHQPLKVHVVSANDAVQVWCITNRLTKSRQELATWLDSCFSLV